MVFFFFLIISVTIHHTLIELSLSDKYDFLFLHFKSLCFLVVEYFLLASLSVFFYPKHIYRIYTEKMRKKFLGKRFNNWKVKFNEFECCVTGFHYIGDTS